MKLEPILQSEVSQKEKDKYRILLYIQNLEKWYWRIYLQGNNGETDIEKRLMDMGRGEGEMYGKCNMETYISICKIDSQLEFAVCLRKLKQGLYINLEGWDGEADGRELQEGIYVYLWMIYVDVWQKTAKFCKEIILQ